ncbi:MAG: hypothetical protein KC420_21535, partial [Myxococcales bacterium]|nr:hypothetical protein [Myxococcales bacterium]
MMARTWTSSWAGAAGLSLALACSGGDDGNASATTGVSATATTGASASASTSAGTGTSGATGGETGSASASTTSAGTSGVTSTSAGTTDGLKMDMGGGDLPPPEMECSADLHAVVDPEGNVLEMCADDQGCADGACVPACDAAAASKASFGCGFIVPTPPAYPPALPPCFAAFLANTWGHPAKITVSRGGVELDISGAARLVTPGVAPKDWPPLGAEGIPADGVAVVFLSSDPNSIMPETKVPLTCPVTPAVNSSTVIPGSGRGQAFVIGAD